MKIIIDVKQNKEIKLRTGREVSKYILITSGEELEFKSNSISVETIAKDAKCKVCYMDGGSDIFDIEYDYLNMNEPVNLIFNFKEGEKRILWPFTNVYIVVAFLIMCLVLGIVKDVFSTNVRLTVLPALFFIALTKRYPSSRLYKKYGSEILAFISKQ